MKKCIFFVLLMFVSLFSAGSPCLAAEPAIADYTHYPIFQVNAVEPNIMIILDNSGSMNFNAYGTYPGDGGLVVDAPYTGEPYNQANFQVRVSQDSDDAEEAAGGLVYANTDLDLGDIPVGIRFQNVAVPQGATIVEAYITFTAAVKTNSTGDPATSATFHGEAADNPVSFAIGANFDISSRPDTAASVAWNSLPAWVPGQTYQSPDLKTIVQEIVDRAGWASGNAMVLKVTGSGNREAVAFDALVANTEPLLYVRYEVTAKARYYGYFNPDYFYYWNSTKFDHKYRKVAYVGDPTAGGYWSVRDLAGNAVNLTDAMIVSEALWDGNWMNWVSMRRLDVLRKVLVGGEASARTGGGNQINYGEIPNQASRRFIKRFNSSGGAAVSPHDGGDYWYGMSAGYVYIDDDNTPFSGQIARYRIAIQKNILYEPEDFHNYDTGDNLAGVLQRVGDKARWGNLWFNYGSGAGESGGTVAHTIGTDIVSLVANLESTGGDTWTPLAESYYVAVQYFKQEDPQAGLDYPANAVPHASQSDDPYYNNQYVECADSFVILLTDGASTKDSKVPASLKDYDADGNDNLNCVESTNTNCDYPDGGTDYLDDIALYARTTDLRDDLEGTQNITLYAIYAFGSDADARTLLRAAAKNGGFEDRNGNSRPDLDIEWDKDGDGIPDTYYEATDGYALERELLNTINDILNRAAAGTAVSVLATTGEGEGTLVQAYFRPSVPVGVTEVDWVGYLQSLWVDTRGNLREDTVQDQTLDVTEDKVVSYYLDSATGNTRIRRFSVSAQAPYPDLENDPFETLELQDVTPIWEAGGRLAQRDPADRNIFTYIDKDKDGAVDEALDDQFDDQGEVVRFHTGAASSIKPYLGVRDNATWSDLGAAHDTRVTNVINYIRGTEVAGLRTRTIDGNVWKLGDIVYSTPVSLARPPDNYHVIYADESYRDYYVANRNRETIVYVGANDGMLHAFTSWQYDPSTRAFTRPSGTTEAIGDELWAYIPQSLLPHLKWLPSEDYTHVDYVDLKPKVFDAKIDHDRNAGTPAEWRTLLVTGLNMGGKYIWAEGDFDDGSGTLVFETRHFYPSYTCMDVTDPRNPRLLWERSYGDLEMTSSFPAAVKVKEKWFLVFGSGPGSYEGTSTKNGHVFVVDLETGAPYRSGTNDWLFETGEANAFVNAPVSLDKNLNFSVDAIYLGTAYLSGSWQGKLHKIVIPSVDAGGNYNASTPDNYIDDPKHGSYPWRMVPLLDATRPITSPVALSVDPYDNAWVYVGSGRYLSTADKTNTDTQYMYGVKDPFFNRDRTTYYHVYSTSLELGIADLFNADPYIILEGGYDVYVGETRIGDYNDLIGLSQAEDGWMRSLGIPGERILTKFAILGGIVFTPSFVPSSDVCGFGGDSYLYGQYYETGTAYKTPVFTEDGIKNITISGQVVVQVLDKIELGSGKASAIGVHVGTEGAKALIQQSTGTVVSEVLQPALKVKSGLRSWIER